ncbi:MAG TPA: type II toxin-antitoxin system PemK/MazF family toxin [Actinocrinis sp.]|jgi:hypothetical protein
MTDARDLRDPGDPFHDSPGRYGDNATIEVDPRAVGPVHTSYAPNHDGDPDPGEIVWTWVPYEEHDGRGKDRPVLIVAREKGHDTLLAIKLTSQRHDDERNWIDVGHGHWDRDGHESWAVLDRVVRVHPKGMRREACALERQHYDVVIAALHQHYRWT